MAVISFLDSSEFDSTKSYFNKLKTKEEVCYLVLEGYRGQTLNGMVKAVIIDDTVATEDYESTLEQGVLYIKKLDFSSSSLTLEDFLEEHINPVDIYTYVVELSETYNDLRELTKMVSKYSDTKVRFIGGNLLAIEGAGVGFFPEGFIATNKLKTDSKVRFNFTNVKLIDANTLVTREYEEFSKRQTQAKKSSVTKARKGSKPATQKVARKRSAMDILSSY